VLESTLQFRLSGVVLLYFEHQPGLCNATVDQKNRSKLPILPNLPILTFYSPSTISYSRRKTQSARSARKMPDFENIPQKAHLFASFFSIFLHFFLFFLFSLSFCNFFFNFSSFLKPPPLILAQYRGCPKIPPYKTTPILNPKIKPNF